jgi:hypothetical protein
MTSDKRRHGVKFGCGCPVCYGLFVEYVKDPTPRTKPTPTTVTGDPRPLGFDLTQVVR